MQYLVKNIDATFRQINKSSLKFLTALTPEEMYTAIVSEALQLFSATDGRLLLKGKRKLETVYTSGDLRTYPKIRKNGFTLSSFKTNEILIRYDTDIKHIHPVLIDSGIKATIFIPLSYKNKTIGILNLRFKKRIIVNNEILEIIKLFGSLSSMAMQKAYLYFDAKRSLEVRDLFINFASHELRTPLTGISLYAQLLKKKFENTDTPEALWTKQLFHETKRLTVLIQELLQVDQMKTEKFSYHVESLNLLSVIKEAITSCGFIYPQQQIQMKRMKKNIKFFLSGDKNKLVQVFINIFTNAAKFSAPDSPIMVLIDSKEKYFTISVVNTGKGIPKADLPKIFDRFYKASNNVKDGMGLGLFISQNIIKAHKGTISIASIEGQQTTVSVKLPKNVYVSKNVS